MHSEGKYRVPDRGLEGLSTFEDSRHGGTPTPTGREQTTSHRQLPSVDSLVDSTS